MLSLILSFVCAILMCCAFVMPKSVKAATLKSANQVEIGELTLTNYDSTSGNVFDGNKLANLYSALTGGNGATLQAVKNTVLGNHSDQYGFSKPVTLPEYKTAADLYAMNGNKNIVVRLNGQEFAVSFLTTDQNGDLIATLWMTQPLKDSSGTVSKGKFGWASANYNVNYTATIGESYIANAYATSQLRMSVLNAGPVSGTETKYAMGSTNANVTSLGQTVTTAERQSNVLAPFTLDNSALAGTSYANKSLINYIATPSQMQYTYYLDWPYASGDIASSYILNEALSKDASGNFTLSTSVGTTDTTFFTAGAGAHKGYWWNAGVYNYANSTVNHYNDWGTDYVWLPSLSETGYYNKDDTNAAGLWSTGDGINRQTAFNNEDTAPDSTVLTGTTNSTEYVWLRSGHARNPYHSKFLSSSGGYDNTYTAATLAVRPALHLNLTKADGAGKVISKPTNSNTSTYSYDGAEKEYLPTNFNSATMEITGNKQTDAGDYTAYVTPKDGYTWTDGTTAPVTFNFKINKATPTVTPIFSGERPFNTDDFPQPESYTAGANGITITGTFSWINQTIECNKSKEYEWTFTPDNEFINNFTTATGKQTFNFQERKIDSMEVSFDAGGKIVYTKTPESELMNMITLIVHYNDGKVVEEKNFKIEYALVEGEGNEIAVIFGEQLPKMVAVDVYVQLAKVTDLTVLFKQNGAVITPNTPINDLKQYLSVYPTWNYTSESKKLADSDYELDGVLTVGTPVIAVMYEGAEKTFTPTVTKDSYNFTPVFEDKIIGKGKPFPQNWITGLPNGVTVEYSCADCNLEGELAVGTHTITATFSGDYDKYEQIPDATATLTVENNYQTPSFVQDTLDYNPEGNLFELVDFDEIKDIVSLTCKGSSVTLAEALNKTEIEDYELTITLNEGKFLGDKQSVTLYYSIVKCKVSAPAFVGGLVFSGSTLTAKATDFEFDGSVIAFVGAESGMNAGSYTAVFELKDTDHYEWATQSARRVPVKKALSDEAVQEGQIQVPWTITKATVSATVEEGKMPVFTCATVGNLDSYVSYTYYKDELCTEQIAFSELKPDTRYYVKATFTDEQGNFELDDSAIAVINGRAAAYDTAAKDPTFIQKAFAFVKQNWLWFAIGGGALLFLILLIIIIAAASKKNKQKAAERKAEKKEEERQRREEEREERMMRMQSMQNMPITAAGMIAAQQAQQAMPVAQPQPQPVQQSMPTPVQQSYAPAPVQTAAAADTSVLEERLRLAEERARYAEERIARAAEERARAAEERTIRAAEERARLAEEQLMRNAYMNRVNPAAGGENGNISLDALGALVLAALKNYAGGEHEQVAPAEQPQMIEAPTQTANIPAIYPPDAVITTTTTVDTTKKSDDKPLRRSKPASRETSERNEFADVDGFYDSID